MFVQGRFWQEASSEVRRLGGWDEGPGGSDTVGQGVSLGGQVALLPGLGVAIQRV